MFDLRLHGGIFGGGQRIYRAKRKLQYSSIESNVFYIDFKRREYAAATGSTFYKYDFSGNVLFSKPIVSGNTKIIGATNEEYLVVDVVLRTLSVYDYTGNIKLSFSASTIKSSFGVTFALGCISKDTLIFYDEYTRQAIVYDRNGNILRDTSIGNGSDFYENWLIGGKDIDPILIVVKNNDYVPSIQMQLYSRALATTDIYYFTAVNVSQFALQLITYMMGGK